MPPSVPRFVAVAALTLAPLVAQCPGGPPSNDDPSGAIAVFAGVNPGAPSGASGTYFTTAGATDSAGYGSPCGSNLTADVFFLYTATTAGLHAFANCTPAGFAPGSLADSAIAVYGVGSPFAPLACDDDACVNVSPGNSGLLSQVVVSLSASETVYVRVATYGVNPPGDFYLSVVPPTSDGGNTCALAPAIGVGVHGGQLFGKTASGLVVPGCASFTSATFDVFYAFTAPSTGECVVQREGGGATRMAASTGACAAPTLVAGSCVTASYVRFPVVAGATYVLRFGALSAPASAAAGRFVFTVGVLAPRFNDACATASALAQGDNLGSSVGMTADPAVAACAANFSPTTALDAWFSYVVASTGVVRVRVFASTSHQAAIYRGGTCASLGTATCPASAVNGLVDAAPAVAGDVIRVRVGAVSAGAAGAFNVRIEELPPPLNDDCAGAAAAPLGVGLNGPYNACGATTGGPAFGCAASYRDLWHAFVAPISGVIRVDGCGSANNAAFAAYDACGGVQIACDADDLLNAGPCATTAGFAPFLTFPVVGGSTYLVRVANADDHDGLTYVVNVRYKFGLDVTSVPAPPPTPASDMTLRVVAGTPGRACFNAMTLTQGAFPNGWLYGIDIPFGELLTLPFAGPPFLVVLDVFGEYAVTIPGVPTLGATFYAVPIELGPTGLPTAHGDPISFVL